MRQIYRIAVIGSRKTDAETLNEMYITLLRGFNMLHAQNIEFEYRSGGCWQGPDQLQFMFARQWRDTVLTDSGRQLITTDRFVCYLPDNKKMWLAHQHPNIDFRVIEQDDHYKEIVTGLHPAPDKLEDYAWRLHGRNLNIIMGDDLKSPVDAVYYSASLNKHGEPTGGTAMGVKYAKQCGIPCYHHALDGRAWLESLRPENRRKE